MGERKSDFDKPEFNESFAYAIGIVIAICLAILVGYIITKTGMLEAWLCCALIPLGLISYAFYMKTRFNITL